MVQQNIDNISDSYITDDNINETSLYVTLEDISENFKDDTLLVVQAPIGTALEFPAQEENSSVDHKYQIHLKSTTGQINVLLVDNDQDPVAVDVPIPEDIAEAIENLSVEKSLIENIEDFSFIKHFLAE